MNENELLARLLRPDGQGWYVCEDGDIVIDKDTVNFRTSNEWTGALLEKLEKNRIELHSYRTPDGFGWGCAFFIGNVINCTKPQPRATWRDAVVDAALEIAKREAK